MGGSESQGARSFSRLPFDILLFAVFPAFILLAVAVVEYREGVLGFDFMSFNLPAARAVADGHSPVPGVRVPAARRVRPRSPHLRARPEHRLRGDPDRLRPCLAVVPRRARLALLRGGLPLGARARGGADEQRHDPAAARSVDLLARPRSLEADGSRGRADDRRQAPHRSARRLARGDATVRGLDRSRRRRGGRVGRPLGGDRLRRAPPTIRPTSARSRAAPPNRATR